MGTRGAFGFIKNKEYKVSYNHWDSYLEGKGQGVVNFIKETPIDEMNNIFNKIILVNQTDIPNKKQLKEISDFLDEYGLGNQCDPKFFGSGQVDWYYLLSNTQGNFEHFNNGLRYMTDDKEFLNDGLFCEYAYLIDLDNSKLIIKSNDREVLYDFDKIPDNWIDETYEKLENKCKDKFINLLFDKSSEEQKKTINDLNMLEFIKTPLKPYDYYVQEDTYKEILKHYDEKELETILDNYIESKKEIN